MLYGVANNNARKRMQTYTPSTNAKPACLYEFTAQKVGLGVHFTIKKLGKAIGVVQPLRAIEDVWPVSLILYTDCTVPRGDLKEKLNGILFIFVRRDF